MITDRPIVLLFQSALGLLSNNLEAIKLMSEYCSVCGVDLHFGESASRSTVGGSFSFLPETGAATDLSLQIHYHQHAPSECL